MALTVLPAPDMSGQNEGWRLLAEATDRQRRERHARETAYQSLITKLSDPDTTEAQQNALLTQDPKTFKNVYGVDISQVGKDVASFKTAAGSVGAPNGMQMSNAALAPGEGVSKRVLVAHPGGTAQEQQQAASLESTRASTESTRAGVANEATRTRLAQQSTQAVIASADTDIRKNMRRLDGKVPTFNDIQGYRAGTIELTPVTDATTKYENLSYLLGVDPATPAGKMILHDAANATTMSDKEIEKATATIRDTNATAALKEQEWGLIQQGINPKTGKPWPTGTEVKPEQIATIGKGFGDVFARAAGELGLTPGMTTQPKLDNPLWQWAFDKISAATSGDNPQLQAAIFGNGRADPASVRADILASIPRGSKVLTIDFPTTDKKTGGLTQTQLSIDQAVQRVIPMRRIMSTELPALFTAMKQMSPLTLAYMADGNPLIERAAKVYDRETYDLIQKARALRGEQAPPPGATDAAPVEDPNASPLTGGMTSMQRELDQRRKMYQGATAPPPAKAH